MNTYFKKTIALVLSVLLTMSFAAIGVSAEDEIQTQSLAYALNSDKETAMLVSCDPSSVGDIIVSSQVEIQGKIYPVTTIAAKAFYNCANVRTITLDEGIETILDEAFVGCSSLISINIPKSLMSCAFSAFEGCSDFTINCYDNNYQYFAMYAMSSNVTINVIDSSVTDQVTGIFDTIASYVNVILEFIAKIFGIDLGLDGDFDFGLDELIPVV